MITHNGHDSPKVMRNPPKPTERPTPAAAPAPRPKKKKGSHIWLWFFLFLIVMGLIAAAVFWHKQSEQSDLNADTQKMAVPTVQVTHPEKGEPQLVLTLPGTVEAEMESAVYAQVAGYVKSWTHDIGTHVKAGDLLAEIDTPVTDQSLKQSQESVKQAEANLALAQTTADRYNALFVTHAVSQQDVDNQNAGVKVQEANLSAAQAFEQGIEKTESFKQVKAPFDGVITARRVDVGDFVSATGQTASTGSGPAQTGIPNQEMFRIAQIKTLRIYVNVPEQNADQTVPGIKANVELASNPNHTVVGKLVRTADAIDPTSLTLLAEVDVDNPEGTLLPGGYAQVHFDISNHNPPLIIPGNSLIFRQEGPQVGVVDDSNTVHIKNIKIGRDLGTKLEIVDGLDPNDQVIVNPSDSLEDGLKVQIDTSQKKQ
jgi:multidrug efflux pump subunit AcrA (membrane-fusion protein)